VGIETAAAAVTALATVIAVVMAGWTVLESRRLREVQTSPEVIVYLDMNERAENVVDLVVRNIGVAPAYLVKLDNAGKIPFGLIPVEDVYVVHHGINLMAPGQAIRFSLNTYNALPSDEVTIDVCYFAKGEADHRPCRRQSFTLRPLEFQGIGGFENRQRSAWIATKKGMDSLKKAMDQLAGGRTVLTVRPEARAGRGEIGGVRRMITNSAAPETPESNPHSNGEGKP
jgi:hypothetical protein